ncbi:MAG: hypothetical protein PHQ17_06785 [Methanobacterium sp.]|nr:hypothetical protein [Methanobacterium sp.]
MSENKGSIDIQENIKNFLKKIFEEKKVKKSEFIVAIIVNVILFYIVNNLLSWNFSFITSSFQDVLWIFNISICATIIANIIFLAYHPGWFRSLAKIVLNILSFYVCYYLFTIFPFIFSQTAYTIVVKMIIIMGMVALLIISLVEVLRLIVNIVKP